MTLDAGRSLLGQLGGARVAKVSDLLFHFGRSLK